jgi:hypothetical protein
MGSILFAFSMTQEACQKVCSYTEKGGRLCERVPCVLSPDEPCILV